MPEGEVRQHQRASLTVVLRRVRAGVLVPGGVDVAGAGSVPGGTIRRDARPELAAVLRRVRRRVLLRRGVALEPDGAVHLRMLDHSMLHYYQVHTHN